ncbi:MAG: Crp/Fnr family transcriptional regulator [Imperialibacter sp.]|uniref:Crp/Fnr family transcriptional regulator n=1 Tax=Imperialibacter sp. TaxID=2038411 RepID=UPI0032EABE7A
MVHLEKYIRSTVQIGEELEDILSYFEPRQVKKDRHLVCEGQIMDVYYFILSGGLRVYFNHEEKEVTAWLSFESDWLVDIACIRTGRPTIYNIHAIEDTEVVSIKAKHMDALYQKYPKWQELGRKLWERAFLEVVEGMIRHQTMSAEERYLHFMQQSDLLQKVPLKQLSSFLGITPSSLSRLRKNIK